MGLIGLKQSQQLHLFFDVPSPSSRRYFATMGTISIQDDVAILADFIKSRKHLICLTGAGISTNSGIPDYRGENGSYKKGHKPMLHSDFVGDELSRKRYWARSSVGWKFFTNARANKAHYALAILERKTLLKHTITQNVDQLHQKAGSQNVIDLHGRNDLVTCLACGSIQSRKILQQQLELLNPDFMENILLLDKRESIRADGDAELLKADYEQVKILDAT